ncbi:MAG: sigma-54-dependent transcriptional regulator [Vicinamibacteria bacterium]
MLPESGEERILIVDDSAETREVLERNLRSHGYAVLTASDVEGAVGLLGDGPVQLVITDLRMPGASGLDLVRHVSGNFRNTEIIMITGYASIEGAVEAVRHGAIEYLPKPFTDDELLGAVERALGRLRLRLPRRMTGVSAWNDYGIVGGSAALSGVLRAIPKAASNSATVLITGESGTGKELVARAIHYQGPRAAGPFLAINCAGIPEGLVESEFFGHVKGAFTGASALRAGFFEAADGGSIFLDEIGDIALSLQGKLLRVLEYGEIQRLGDSHTKRVDVRVIAATNKDLEKLVERGVFREDLFFRLNVISIHVPPMRERDDDILLLVEHFARRIGKEMGKEPPEFSPEVLERFLSYHWPGNVRELENVVRRLLVMTDVDVVEEPDLPNLMRFSSPAGRGLHRTLADVEADHIKNVLASVDGNKTRAAEILGIDRKTLREKLKTADSKETAT